MTTLAYILSLLSSYDTAQPIYSRTLAASLSRERGISPESARVEVSAALRRIRERNLLPLLRRFRPGVYYLTEVTVFGELGIDKEQIIDDKYLLPDEGYTTDLYALYSMGLSTYLPNERVIATNHTSRRRTIPDLDITVRPPRVPVTRENKAALRLLDVLCLFPHAPVNVDNPYFILARYVRKAQITFPALRALAAAHYPKRVMGEIAWIEAEGAHYDDIA